MRHQAGHLLRIDIDADQVRRCLRFDDPAPHTRPAHIDHFHARSDADHAIGFLPQLPRGVAGHRKWVISGHDASAAAESRDGRVQFFCQRKDFILGIPRSGPDHDQRPFRLAQQFCSLCDHVIRQRRGGFQVQWRHFLVRAGHRHIVPAHFDQRWAWPAGKHRLERFSYDPGGVFRLLHPRCVFAEARNRALLIRDLMQMPSTPFQVGAGNLASDTQNGDIAAPSRAQGTHRVQNTRSGHDGIDADFARCLCISERHVGRCLLVAGAECADLFSVAGERVHHRIGLHTWQSEHGVDTVSNQRTDDGFTTGDGFRH